MSLVNLFIVRIFADVITIIQIVRRLNGMLEKSAIRLHTNSAALITKRNSISVMVAMPSLANIGNTVLNIWKA